MNEQSREFVEGSWRWPNRDQLAHAEHHTSHEDTSDTICNHRSERAGERQNRSAGDKEASTYGARNRDSCRDMRFCLSSTTQRPTRDGKYL